MPNEMNIFNNMTAEQKAFCNDKRQKVLQGEKVSAEDLALAIKYIRQDRKSAAFAEPKAKRASKTVSSAADILDSLL